jgi:hypothetical protein
VGEEEIEIGASPAPGTLSITNCPGRCVKLRTSCSSRKRKVKSQLFSTILNTRTSRAECGW